MNAMKFVPLLLLVPTLAGCIINADSHNERTGHYVSSATLARIEPGKSSDYVSALVGEPTRRTKLEAGSEIWKWEYRDKKTRNGAFIFVFSDESTTEIEGATYVEFKDGVVVRSWQD